jgi:acyl transferase domain-containing protein
MDCIKSDYLGKMNNIFSRYAGTHAPQIPVISTCRQEKFVDVFSASYFWDNCRNAVLFNDAISLSLESLNSSPIFLEISCHPVLSSSIMARGVPENRVLCPMHRISTKKTLSVRSNEPGVFLDTLGRLSLLGLNSMDLSGLYGFSAFKSKLINHPLTARVIPPPKSHTLLPVPTATNNRPLSSANLGINRNSHPYLAEHVVNGVLSYRDAQSLLTLHQASQFFLQLGL